MVKPKTLARNSLWTPTTTISHYHPLFPPWNPPDEYPSASLLPCPAPVALRFAMLLISSSTLPCCLPKQARFLGSLSTLYTMSTLLLAQLNMYLDCRSCRHECRAAAVQSLTSRSSACGPDPSPSSLIITSFAAFANSNVSSLSSALVVRVAILQLSSRAASLVPSGARTSLHSFLSAALIKSNRSLLKAESDALLHSSPTAAPSASNAAWAVFALRCVVSIPASIATALPNFLSLPRCPLTFSKATNALLVSSSTGGAVAGACPSSCHVSVSVTLPSPSPRESLASAA
mmetsp:Transcript_24517/g.58805  ORF Transcript_24517/g.58805 Transcript_24517/m.58805 type:complete len:289 (-) Transcript_24517:156-1022(-)